MSPTFRFCAGLILLAASAHSATTLATVGDSFADSFYFGLRSRPDLLTKNDVQLIRWSRPAIGLVRSDQFDYAAWLRDAGELGTADYCVVQVGTNDMQSIPDGAGKWILFPGDAWKNAYTGRVQAMAEMLRSRRCRRVIWVLQPGFEKKAFLARNRELINQLQVAGVGGGGVVLDVAAESADYGRDGIHFSGPFALKLADATLRIVSAWRDRVPESCFACHGSIAVAPQLPLAQLAALRIRPAASFGPSVALLAEGSPRTIIPPPLVMKAAQRVARKSSPRRRRHHA
jgi:lysophospholipase L1-like esterase